jgi:adenine-specific DNA glycosylase
MRRKNSIERRWTFCVRRRDRWLIERRPQRGRWAGMWQFVTVEAKEHPPDRSLAFEKLLTFSHDLTHRHYEFDVFVCNSDDARSITAANGVERKWVRMSELRDYPLSKPHLTVARMLSERRINGPKKGAILG